MNKHGDDQICATQENWFGGLNLTVLQALPYTSSQQFRAPISLQGGATDRAWYLQRECSRDISAMCS